jgi:hypothetical protein
METDMPERALRGAALATCLVLSTAVAPVVMAAPANAAVSCGTTTSDLDPYGTSHKGKDTPAYDDGKTEFRGRYFYLRTKRYYEEAQGNIYSGYRNGDQVWVDVSLDSGRTWSQCGPYSDYRTKWVPHTGKWIRVCIRADGASKCAHVGNETSPAGTAGGNKWWSD